MSQNKTRWYTDRSPKAWLITGIVASLIGCVLIAFGSDYGFGPLGVSLAAVINAGRFWWSGNKDRITEK